MKMCLRCEEVKEEHLFHKNKRKSDGLDIYCKSCNNARVRDKYHADPEWRAGKLKSTRQYHLDNPEWSKAALRRHHELHSEARYQAHKLRGADPEVMSRRRDASRRSEQRRRAVKANSPLVTAPSQEDLDVLLSVCDYSCCICGRLFTEHVVLHWDHIRPLAKGGEHTVDNLQPLCSECNVRKNAIYPMTEQLIESIKSAVLSREAGKEVQRICQ